jgi:hypothetical protein
MSTGLYRLLWRRFGRIGSSLGRPREAVAGRLKVLTALAVAVVLLVGAGAWLVISVDDSESADGRLNQVAGDTTGTASASQAVKLDNASDHATADQANPNQTTGSADPTTVGTAVQGGATPAAAVPAATAGPSQAYAAPEATVPEDKPTVSLEPPAVNGLRISSQSWRRGGLGSKALVTFTLRNDNPYAVKDVALACAFSRRDGSHLTDRTRIVPGPVSMKSRKTFAAVHVGFVNVNASKAKCALVAASKI